MTIDTIERLKALVDEVRGTGQAIVSAWEYTNTNNNQIMFAAFTVSCFCDIYQSPCVKKPRLIYESGKYIGKYLFMNKVH